MGVFRGRGWGEFSWYPFHFVSFTKGLLSLLFVLRQFVFLSVFILKTLVFHYKHKVIFGCSVSRSLLYPGSFFLNIYLLLKSRFHFFFGSNLKKLFWESNYLEVLCGIMSFQNGLYLWKSFVKEFKNYFGIRKIRFFFSYFDKRNSYFLGQLHLWNSFRECFGFKTALPITRSNRIITDKETQT